MSWLCIPCTYSPEQAEESLQICCLDTLQSALSKSKNMPEEFCCKDNLMEFSRCFPFGTTLRRSAQTTQKPQPCSTNSERYQGNSPFVAGSRSRARTSARPEKAQALLEPAQGFGLTWPASSARFDRDSSSWKIHPCLFREDSIQCSVTLPRWGVMRGGELSELTTSAPLISGIGSGSGVNLGTPTAGMSRRSSKYAQGGTPLSMAVMWQTPVADDAIDRAKGKMNSRGEPKLSAQVKLWPTPTVFGNHNRKGLSKNSGDGLATAVKAFRTPNASDARGWSHQSQAEREAKGLQVRLGHQLEAGGSLNPTWVEWLMGWPLGWTDLNALEMDKFQQWQRSHGGCCPTTNRKQSA